LMHCAGAEERYNPYYTLIAKTLCADRRLKIAFQFSLWDFFKRMGERGDDAESDESDEEDERQVVPLNEIVNTARMFGALVADGTMTLAISKTLNLALLKEQTRMFFEVLLVVVICKSQNGAKAARDEDRVATIFAKCKDTPQVIGGLKHFLKKVVRHTDLASSRAEARLLQWGCGVAADILKVVSAGPGERI
jgi:nucleolar MIF4G domain-containing protein 1